jgi:hypothetical protein
MINLIASFIPRPIHCITLGMATGVAQRIVDLNIDRELRAYKSHNSRQNHNIMAHDAQMLPWDNFPIRLSVSWAMFTRD